MKAIPVIIALVVVALLWARDRIAATGLQTELAALRLQTGELESLQREHERLRSLQPSADELDLLQRASAEHAAATREIATREPATPRRPADVLAPGEWLPAARWKNVGVATGLAAVQTAIWAAAGGDIGTFISLMRIDDEVRARADALLAQLPAEARGTYPNVEHLLAAFAIKSIPIGEAQLVWHHESGPDDAVVCVFVRTLDALTVPPRASKQGPDPKAPPMAAPSPRTHAAYLSLRRGDRGWQLVVPPSAVANIAKDLGLRTAAR